MPTLKIIDPCKTDVVYITFDTDDELPYRIRTAEVPQFNSNYFLFGVFEPGMVVDVQLIQTSSALLAISLDQPCVQLPTMNFIHQVFLDHSRDGEEFGPDWTSMEAMKVIRGVFPHVLFIRPCDYGKIQVILHRYPKTKLVRAMSLRIFE